MSSPVRTASARRADRRVGRAAPDGLDRGRTTGATGHRSTKRTPVLASVQRRVAGAAIDMALLIAVSGALAAMLEHLTSGVTRIRIDAQTGQRTVDTTLTLPTWLPLAILVVLTAAYTVPLMARWGRTLGGLAVGIRCVRVDTGAAPGWSLSVRRWVALYGAAGILAFIPVIGPFAWIVTLVVGLSPLWDGTHRLRGYADHLGHDIVIRTRPVTGGS